MKTKESTLKITRFETNPLVTTADVKPSRPDMEILCAFNPGAVLFGDQTLMLVRVAEKPKCADDELATAYYDVESGELKTLHIKKSDPDLVSTDPRCFQYRGKAYLTSISHLRLARSFDGKHFTIDPAPTLFPANANEIYGLEDPRITFIDGKYYVDYSIISDRGVGVGLSVTDDFENFTRLSVMFTTYNKDACIFPERVNGMYVCRHRPEGSWFNKPSIWTAYSPDLLCWGKHQLTMTGRPDSFEEGRIGCGAPPVKTSEGWLEIYHGCDAKGRYCLGAMLSDLEKPERVISRSNQPILTPEADYEMKGLYGNCIFSNGLVAYPDGTLAIFYGAADTVCAAAQTTVAEMVAAAKNEL